MPGRMIRRLSADFKAVLAQAQAFQEKHRGRVAAGEIAPEEFLTAVEEIEQIYIGAHKAAMYADLVFSVDTAAAGPRGFAATHARANHANSKRVALLRRGVAASRTTPLRKRILAHPPLARYAHSLAQERVFGAPYALRGRREAGCRKAPYGHRRLSASLRRAHQPPAADRSPLDGERKEMNETELLALLYHDDRGVRRRAQVAMTKALKDDSHILTYIFNVAAQEKVHRGPPAQLPRPHVVAQYGERGRRRHRPRHAGCRDAAVTTSWPTTTP